MVNGRNFLYVNWHGNCASKGMCMWFRLVILLIINSGVVGELNALPQSSVYPVGTGKQRGCGSALAFMKRISDAVLFRSLEDLSPEDWIKNRIEVDRGVVLPEGYISEVESFIRNPILGEIRKYDIRMKFSPEVLHLDLLTGEIMDVPGKYHRFLFWRGGTIDIGLKREWSHPIVAIHELAHARHDPVAKIEYPRVYKKIKAAFEMANLHPSRFVKRGQAKDVHEYFALGFDYYWFTSDETRLLLQKLDPDLFPLIDGLIKGKILNGLQE